MTIVTTQRIPQAALIAVLLSMPVGAGSPTAEGFWSGIVETPTHGLDVMVDLERDDTGWRAVFYAPAQGIHAAEMEAVAIDGSSVTFRIPRTRGEPTFVGSLSGDGETITGTLTQAGDVLPFRLGRAEKPASLATDIYAEYRRPGEPGLGLAGSWRALLMTGPNRVRLALRVAPGAYGGLEGSLDSIDQDVAAMNVEGITLRDDVVTFRMTEIGAWYEGRMKDDGSEFTGLWRQRGQEFPLTFRRRSAE